MVSLIILFQILLFIFVIFSCNRCWAWGKHGEEFGEWRWQFIRRNCAVVANWDWPVGGNVRRFLFVKSLSICVESIHGKQENNLRNSWLNFAYYIKNLYYLNRKKKHTLQRP